MRVQFFVHSILKFFHLFWDFWTWVTVQTLALKQLYGHFVAKYESLTKCRKDPTRPLPHPLTFLTSRFFLFFRWSLKFLLLFIAIWQWFRSWLSFQKDIIFSTHRSLSTGIKNLWDFFRAPITIQDFFVPAAILC